MPQALQLGRYHLLDRIAFGGMAEIYRAKTFDSLGQAHFVAVKRLLFHLTGDKNFLQMLIDEAKISALLNHRNIARVYELAQVGEDCILAMEFVDGKDVRALLERARQLGQRIPPDHAAWIAMEVASALHAAHTLCDRAGAALHIVHRDVSPSNILCSYAGDVKLCDFGIAKATLTRVQTKTGVIKGKVKYMSPEQAMGRRLDHRTDLFSLGTVLYEMVTLEAPFSAPSEDDLIYAVRDARKRPVRDLAPDCPPALVEIIDKATTRSRNARHQSGEELALDLRLFLDGFRPGYRRSHFSRYMRRQFQPEIDEELRVLEGYTIAPDANVPLGVNLIADALESDAPVTRFTPLCVRPSEAGNARAAAAERARARTVSSVHEAETRLFSGEIHGKVPGRAARQPAPGRPAAAVSPPGGAALHREQTVIFEGGGAGALHEEKTHIFQEPRRPVGLHEEATHIIQRRAAADAAKRPMPASQSMDDEMRQTGDDAADEPSVVLQDDDLEEI